MYVTSGTEKHIGYIIMESTKIFWHGIKQIFIGVFNFDKRRCYIGFSSSVFFVLLGAEQIKSLNTLSCALRMPISIKKYRHQQVTSRLSASSVIVYMGTTFDASKWSTHWSILSAISVLLVGMSFTHSLYCSAWLQFSSRDRIGSRGCDLPLNRWSDGLMLCVGRSAILFVIWRSLSDRWFGLFEFFELFVLFGVSGSHKNATKHPVA